MSIGNFPEMLSQAMLVGVMLVGRLAIPGLARWGLASLFPGVREPVAPRDVTRLVFDRLSAA